MYLELVVFLCKKWVGKLFLQKNKILVVSFDFFLNFMVPPEVQNFLSQKYGLWGS